MTEIKQVRLEEAVTDVELREAISALDQPWQREKARFKIASRLAYGLLVIFGLAVACNGAVVIALIITSTISGMVTEKGIDPATGIDPMLRYITTLLPYIATPLGVAFGYFFRESQEEEEE
jgi:uncharacterized BrkB/YihY/UPF0761 family membrane protein